MKRNVASQDIAVELITAADGTDFTGAATVVVSKDGGAQGASGGTGPTHLGSGSYTYSPSQTETDAAHVAFTFTGTGAISSTVQVYTQFPQTVDNNTKIDIIDTNVDSILVDTGTTIPATLGTPIDTDLATDIANVQTTVDNLAVGAGGISTVATAGSTVTTGTQTLTYTATQELDGVTHDIAPDGGNTEFYYEFNVGVLGVSTEFLWQGYANSNNDSYTVKGYDWTSSTYKTVGTINGTGGTAIIERTFIVTVGMTGTGANAGVVRFQITSADGTKFATDRILCEYTALPGEGTVLHSGVAQAGTTNTITLDTGANATDDYYNHARIVISSGTASEQERIIVSYVGSTRVAKIAPPWVTIPDTTSAFEVEPAITHAETGWGTIKIGIAAAATSTSITLDSTASAVDDFYNDDLIRIDAGTGAGQNRVITDYNGTTKVATIDPSWTTTPDTTSEYVVENGHPYITSDLTTIKADTTAILVDTGTTIPASLTTIDSNVDAILVDTGTSIPATIATAQADLDIITGADGVNLLTATQASIDAIEVDTSTTLPGLIDDLAIKKNATFSNFEFLMVLTSDHVTPATGLTVTGQRSIDGAAFAGVTGTIAEVSNGIYQFDAVAADTNGDVITWRFSSATADDTFVTFKTVA